MAKVKLRIELPPNIKMINTTMIVLIEVLNVRDKVEFSASLITWNRSRFG